MKQKGRPAVRAVIGVPTYNGVQRGYFSEALESLLAQTYPHVAFLFVDDCSSDDTPDVVARVAANDHRVILLRNPSRLGIVRNWRRTFELARELFPEATYFAWGSDHDRWHRKWLKKLVKELDAYPAAVMAYPRYTLIDEHSEEFKKRKAGLVTQGLSRSERFAAASVRKIHAGKLVYGLYRTAMLERAGVYPLVYRPDVYILIELSLYGEIRLVDETLWYRRGKRPSGRRRGPQPLHQPFRLSIEPVTRQHREIFTKRVPLYSRLPPHVQHAALLFWRIAVLGRGRPLVGRVEGSRFATRLLLGNVDQSPPREELSQEPQAGGGSSPAA